MLDPHPDLTQSVIIGLGWMYLVMFAMNAGWTLYSVRQNAHVKLRLLGLLGDGVDVPTASFWAVYSSLLLMVSIAHFTGAGNPESFLIRMPEPIKEAINGLADPKTYFALSVLLFLVMIWAREWLAKPSVGWSLLNLSMLFTALSMTDWDFRQIVGKPDNVPIVGMLFIVGYFTWLFFRRAVENDRRVAEGRPLYEQEDNEKILVWPDLVYTELVCMVLLTAGLIFWGIALQAPLEEPANAAATPNPSKAPWYFLGLQEMLVYFDPWLAGVVLPSIILVGLMAIPYIDFNKKGNGYYTFNERKFAITTFLFGFLPLWIAMIILGTFLRGPNWNFFGIYEYWDVHKLEEMNNVNLSEYFWIYSPWGQGLPTPSPESSALANVGTILLRESPGILLVLIYFLVLPPVMAGTLFRKFYAKMGFIRFMVFANLILWMAALPIKMLLRWSVNMKYIVAIEEYFFNI